MFEILKNTLIRSQSTLPGLWTLTPHTLPLCVTTLGGAEIGGERAENRVSAEREWSGERAWQTTAQRELSVEREVAER